MLNRLNAKVVNTVVAIAVDAIAVEDATTAEVETTAVGTIVEAIETAAHHAAEKINYIDEIQRVTQVTLFFTRLSCNTYG